MTTSKAAGRRTRKGRQRGNGEGGLILRGRIWWCQYYLDGRQIRTSTKTHVRSEALAFLRKTDGQPGQR